MQKTLATEDRPDAGGGPIWSIWDGSRQRNLVEPGSIEWANFAGDLSAGLADLGFLNTLSSTLYPLSHRLVRMVLPPEVAKVWTGAKGDR